MLPDQRPSRAKPQPISFSQKISRYISPLRAQLITIVKLLFVAARQATGFGSSPQLHLQSPNPTVPDLYFMQHLRYIPIIHSWVFTIGQFFLLNFFWNERTRNNVFEITNAIATNDFAYLLLQASYFLFAFTILYVMYIGCMYIGCMYIIYRRNTCLYFMYVDSTLWNGKFVQLLISKYFRWIIHTITILKWGHR